MRGRGRGRQILGMGAIALAALLATVGVACKEQDPGSSDTLRSAPAPVREAYAYAVAYPEVLRYIPCYCGCAALGHTSNEACFVARRLSDGQVVYDSHGLG